QNRGFRDANYLAIRADAALFAIVEMVGSVAVAVLLYDGASRIARGTLTVGILVAFIQYIDRFFAPIRDLSTKYTVMQSAMAAAERIFGLLDNQAFDCAAASGYSPGPNLGATSTATHAPYAVEFLDVHFAYRKDMSILDGITLRVRQGETVAIVGSTGAGK